MRDAATTLMTITFHDQGTGPAVVWIHGFPLTAAVFEPQISISGFRHIRPDLPGFGRTPPPDQPLSVSDYSRQIIDLMDLLKIDRAAVAGLSMGGYILMQMLRDAPARISAVMLLDTRETADTGEGRESRYKQAAEAEATGTASIIDSMLPKMVRDPACVEPVRRIMNDATVGGVVAALDAMAGRPDSSATLRALDVPVLIAVGEHDPITPVADAKRMQSLIAGAELAIISSAAHLANFERAEDFNRAAEAFLHR